MEPIKRKVEKTDENMMKVACRRAPSRRARPSCQAARAEVLADM